MRQIQHHCARQVGGIIRNGRFFPFHSRARSTTEPKTTTTTMTTTKTTTATTTATMTATTLTMTTTTMTTTTIPKPTKFDYSPWTIDLQSVPFESMFSLNIFGFFLAFAHLKFFHFFAFFLHLHTYFFSQYFSLSATTFHTLSLDRYHLSRPSRETTTLTVQTSPSVLPTQAQAQAQAQAQLRPSSTQALSHPSSSLQPSSVLPLTSFGSTPMLTSSSAQVLILESSIPHLSSSSSSQASLTVIGNFSDSPYDPRSTTNLRPLLHSGIGPLPALIATFLCGLAFGLVLRRCCKLSHRAIRNCYNKIATTCRQRQTNAEGIELSQLPGSSSGSMPQHYAPQPPSRPHQPPSCNLPPPSNLPPTSTPPILPTRGSPGQRILPMSPAPSPTPEEAIYEFIEEPTTSAATDDYMPFQVKFHYTISFHDAGGSLSRSLALSLSLSHF